MYVKFIRITESILNQLLISKFFYCSVTIEIIIVFEAVRIIRPQASYRTSWSSLGYHSLTQN